ncbi:MAG: hypothetical protein O3A00_07560 [Planctomycetota bacterium]|nr:hypothetical protein [Planctomycetota bacterium]
MRFQRPRRALFAVVALVLIVAWSDSANAGGWMFQRSYYSHNVAASEQQSFPRPNHRSAYRRPVYDSSPGFSVRSGYRYNRYQLRSGTDGSDVTVIREGWIQER